MLVEQKDNKWTIDGRTITFDPGFIIRETGVYEDAVYMIVYRPGELYWFGLIGGHWFGDWITLDAKNITEGRDVLYHQFVASYNHAMKP